MNGGFDMEQKQEKFSTIGYIAAALGMCIGTGNVSLESQYDCI